jgi:hypothetical protein
MDSALIEELARFIARFHDQDPDATPRQLCGDPIWMLYQDDAEMFLKLMKKIGPVK